MSDVDSVLLMSRLELVRTVEEWMSNRLSEEHFLRNFSRIRLIARQVRVVGTRANHIEMRNDSGDERATELPFNYSNKC